jgi:hypothetical protein
VIHATHSHFLKFANYFIGGFHTHRFEPLRKPLSAAVLSENFGGIYGYFFFFIMVKIGNYPYMSTLENLP